ncbi:MAG: glycosyltransferase family 39 protein [Anaerolineales bacterium]|nr:glycosyltransferase family 39 protein [Anaerolineales bacterium]
MPVSSSKPIPQNFARYWPWFFFAAAFESLLALVSLFSIPSENGLSAARLGLAGILALLVLAGIFLGFRARQTADWFNARIDRPAILSAALLFLTCGLLLFLLRYLNPEKLLPYYERAAPLLWVLLIVAFQALIFFSLIKNGFHPQSLQSDKPTHRSAALIFSGLLILFLFIVITKIGVKPDSAYWGEPGVALQGWQFILSILIGLSLALYATKPDSRLATYALPIALYLVAILLWLSVPNEVLKSSFYAPMDPPTDLPFPYSDAGFYDYLSQSLLIGTKYLNGIPPRPFYVVFLALLHFCFGQNYSAMIVAQTLVLALFPVSLYFLAKKLHSPAAGVIVALFAIFREWTSLWISSNTRVVNSKMFTTDFPTALALSFTCLVLLWWLNRRDVKSTLIAGGAFGLLLLFRTQSLFILPAVFLLAWFVYQRNTKAWFLTGVIFALAMVSALAPWLIHNYQLTGKLAFDDPRQMAIIYSQYSFNETFNLQEFDPESSSLGGRMLQFTLQNPAYVATFIAAHFLNTEIGGLLALPLFAPFESLIAPINLYWVGWDGSLEWYNALLLIFYLLIISIGLASAWRKLAWLGLLPLAFNLGYALANGVSRFSSWRYNLPVDWAVYFYFAIGVVAVWSWIQALFGQAAQVNEKTPSGEALARLKFRPQFILLLLGFAFVGAIPWLAQGLAQPRYTATQAELIAKIESREINASELEAFLAQPAARLIEGRLLYPRFYSRGRGIASANPWRAYQVQDFARLGFLVLNQMNTNAIYITQEPFNFPHGADVILLGCQRAGYLEARIVIFAKQIYQNAPLTQLCD